MTSPIRTWLRRFAAAVRSRDYAAGARLFAPDVVGFGTVAADVRDIDALVARQWRVIWAASQDFDFDHSSSHVHVAGDHAWAAALWSSSGQPGGKLARRRSGRATIVFRRINGRWRAVHSHFSLTPRNRA